MGRLVVTRGALLHQLLHLLRLGLIGAHLLKLLLDLLLHLRVLGQLLKLFGGLLHLLGGVFLGLLIHFVEVFHRIFELGGGLVEVTFGDLLAGFAYRAFSIIRRLEGLHQGILGFGVFLGFVPFLGGFVIHFLKRLQSAAICTGGVIELGSLVELMKLRDQC